VITDRLAGLLVAAFSPRITAALYFPGTCLSRPSVSFRATHPESFASREVWRLCGRCPYLQNKTSRNTSDRAPPFHRRQGISSSGAGAFSVFSFTRIASAPFLLAPALVYAPVDSSHRMITVPRLAEAACAYTFLCSSPAS